MDNGFLLRFNCQKSGLDIKEDTTVFAEIFDENRDDIKAFLSEYQERNISSFSEICQNTEMDILQKKFQKAKFLATGDSITSDRCSYEKIFELALPGQVFDRAISGSYSINIASNIDKYLAEIMPDYVIVAVGTNDSLFTDKAKSRTSTSTREYARNLRIIAEKVRLYGAKLIIISIPPVFEDCFNKNNMFWSVSDENNAAFNETAKLTAKETGAVFCDCRFVFQNEKKEDMFEPDGLHLSPYAHKKVAQALINKLIETEF